MVIYHGGKRTSDPGELAAADVVLTTYSIVESEFRKNCLPGKVACRYCNTKMYPDRLRLHLKCDLHHHGHMSNRCADRGLMSRYREVDFTMYSALY